MKILTNHFSDYKDKDFREQSVCHVYTSALCITVDSAEPILCICDITVKL